VTADAPTPLPLRPSEADRERVARLLRERSVEGRLSLDTFSDRIERVYGARSRRELDALVSDVRGGGLRGALLRLVEWCSRLETDIATAWRRPRLPALSLPTGPRSVTLGRSPGCDCVLADDTVSRRHALLRRQRGRWLLRDLGSRNGTRVNGMRVLEETEVRPGDRVSLGDARYVLTLPRSGVTSD
jgi:FHA domain/Domain of unknown function (DUF1707)